MICKAGAASSERSRRAGAATRLYYFPSHVNTTTADGHWIMCRITETRGHNSRCRRETEGYAGDRRKRVSIGPFNRSLLILCIFRSHRLQHSTSLLDYRARIGIVLGAIKVHPMSRSCHHAHVYTRTRACIYKRCELNSLFLLRSKILSSSLLDISRFFENVSISLFFFSAPSSTPDIRLLR